jgi:iron complex transport system ATP-binding protein
VNPVRLELSGVHARYPARGAAEVLRGLDLRLQEGEVVALIGPNGAGKSTVLRVASGVLRPTAGRVHLLQRDLAALGPGEIARQVAVVPQDSSSPAGLSVREMVELGRIPHLALLAGPRPRDRAAVRAALEATRTTELADRFVDELSGGERQRVLLARALAQEPRVLLLDEPTANLDLYHQVALLDVVRRLARETGLAVLAAVHDLQLAALYCDRVVLLADGVVVGQGVPEAVLTAPLLLSAFGQPVALSTHPTHGVPLVALVPNGHARRVQR